VNAVPKNDYRHSDPQGTGIDAIPQCFLPRCNQRRAEHNKRACGTCVHQLGQKHTLGIGIHPGDQHSHRCHGCYDTYQRRISECDQQLQKHLAAFADTVPPPAKQELPPKKKGKQNKNNPHFHLADGLQRITGVDLTRIDGVDVMVAQTLVSEVGLDMSRWKTEAHFASWLGLCPDNRISGDRVLARGTRHAVNRAATALRMGASTLLRGQTYLGAQYRRLRSKLGAPKAITAMAHRLARLVYRMLKYGQRYVDKGAEYYGERNRQ
jgi:transposase